MKINLRGRVKIKEVKSQHDRNMDTAARIKSVLARLNTKEFTTLALAESDSDNDMYEIRMGSNHSVFCTCKGWQYSKNGTCKHIERFKEQYKTPFLVRRG